MTQAGWRGSLCLPEPYAYIVVIRQHYLVGYFSRWHDRVPRGAYQVALPPFVLQEPHQHELVDHSPTHSKAPDNAHSAINFTPGLNRDSERSCSNT